MDHGYSFERRNKIATLNTPGGKRIVLDIINDVPYMPQGSVTACGAILLNYIEHDAFPGPVVEEIDDNDGVEESEDAKRDLEPESNSLWRTMTHFPKNKYCDTCQRATMMNTRHMDKGGSSLKLSGNT